LSNLANWIGGWHDNWPRLRQAVQTTVAACLAYAAAELVNAPQGFWAVMTAILVTQANVGASLGLAEISGARADGPRARLLLRTPGRPSASPA